MRRHTELLLLALLAAQTGCAATAPPAPEKTAAAAPVPEPESRQKAAELLDGMAKFMISQQTFRVSILAGYEVLQHSGQKIEFGERRQIALQRPDKLRIEKVGSDGGRDLTLFDGKQVTTYDAGAKIYATSAQPGNLDATVVHYVRDLGMRLPLAPLVMATLPDELHKRVQEVDYVEGTDLFGERCHHIAGRTVATDVELWIADGPRPLLRRIAITYRDEPGQPRFWADFSNWDLSPRLAAADFEFTPAADAKKVPFAAELASAQMPVSKGETSAKGGAK